MNSLHLLLVIESNIEKQVSWPLLIKFKGQEQGLIQWLTVMIILI